MADEARESITVEADPAAIMAVIADFASYPQWVDMINETEVLETGADGRPSRARFRFDVGIVKDSYVLDYTWHGDESVSWALVSSTALRAQRGSYTLVALDGRTEVTYELLVELKLPLLPAFKRMAQQAIVDTALKGLKKRVESRAG